MSVEVNEAEVVKAEETKEEQYDTTFRDERGREWDIKLTVPLMYHFCREHKLTLQQIFDLSSLSTDIILDLAYSGTRYQARAKAEKQTKEMFLMDLDGPAFIKCAEAGSNAIINFSLRMTPQTERAAMKKAIDDSIQTQIEKMK